MGHLIFLLYLSGRNEKGRQWNNESEKAFVKTQEYVWGQNTYVSGLDTNNFCSV